MSAIWIKVNEYKAVKFDVLSIKSFESFKYSDSMQGLEIKTENDELFRVIEKHQDKLYLYKAFSKFASEVSTDTHIAYKHLRTSVSKYNKFVEGMEYYIENIKEMQPKDVV
tara:strand:- start:1394 stop:1726 length:333 start_codon:yes stop_codon:yes gene_type:complete